MHVKAKLVRWMSGVLLILGAPIEARALQEQFEDLSATVEVGGVFGLDVPQTFLTFHNLSPGETKTLGEGQSHEVKCRSNSGRPWYLKSQVVSLRETATGRALPVSYLRWRIVDATGDGAPAGGGFQEFTEQPSLVYASHGLDEKGRVVVLKFQYSLTSPPSAIAGTYVGHIIFTMAESP